MKKWSIRLKITLWFAAALILVVALTYVTVLFAGDRVIQKTVRDSLIRTVEDNVNEVEWYPGDTDPASLPDADDFVGWGGGLLEIDDDYLDAVNGVTTALYQENGTLIYGANPIPRHTGGLTFQDHTVQRLTVGKTLYYVFDRKLSGEKMEGLWLRGVVSENQGAVRLDEISRISLIILPALVLLAIAGGWAIAGRAFRPIRKMSETATHISSGDDLKKRIVLGEGSDELHQLGEAFNQMIARLDGAFTAERQFTSDVSHELRTPAAVIGAQCEYTLEEPRTQEEYEKALEVISRQQKKMTSLIETMLDFVRMETDSGVYRREPLDLGTLTASLCQDLALIRENGVTLTWEVPEALWVRGDRKLLGRLLSNLISNAYRYSKPQGHIAVTLKAQENQALLSVADDGIGIEKEAQAQIFRRFYQADPSRSSGGAGLGLSMVAEIARFHGGTVAVESEPGVGSTFTVALPMAPQEKI